MVSLHALGFTRQDISFLSKAWSRQAWLQAIHVFISSSLPSLIFSKILPSARNGLAIETKSASPFAKTVSATSGIFILFDVITGTLITLFKRLVTEVKAALGTIVAMVGTGLSCHEK